MSLDIEIAFPPAKTGKQFAQLLDEMGAATRRPPNFNFHDRLTALHQLSDTLISADSPYRQGGLPGVAFLAAFLRRDNLEKLVSRELRSMDALTKFTPVSNRKSMRLVPKGVVCHWIAGNVPLLGMFSWAVSALLGNSNLIRLSSRQGNFVGPLLELLSTLSDSARAIAEETLVVAFDRDNRPAHERMSQVADVRIAWGAQEAVEAIRSLPSRWECEDIVFGPRVSLAVVDPAEMASASLERLTTDIIYFDQMACSSPQVLYFKGDRQQAECLDFLATLEASLDRQTQAIQRHSLDFAETYQIQLDRTRVLLSGGDLRRDEATRWTLALLDEPRSDVVCANRFLQVVPFQSLDDIYPRIPRNVQTVILALGEQEAAEFSERAACRGVCRFPRPGEGNHFDNPWDGVPLVSRLTRSILRSDVTVRTPASHPPAGVETKR